MQHSLEHREGPWIGGLILIMIGALLLVSYVVPDAGRLILLALGLVFLIAFLVTRRYGFLVPAGILTGLGVAVALAPLVTEGPVLGAVIVASLAAGFAGIWIVGELLHLPESNPWPLIPAAILAIVAMGVASDQPEVLRWLGVVLAVGMIASGALLIWWRGRAS